MAGRGPRTLQAREMHRHAGEGGPGQRGFGNSFLTGLGGLGKERGVQAWIVALGQVTVGQTKPRGLGLVREPRVIWWLMLFWPWMQKPVRGQRSATERPAGDTALTRGP